MARAKKDSSAKEKKPKKEPVLYHDFIRTKMHDIMMKHMPVILDICKRFEGINEIDKESWEILDKIVLEVSSEALKDDSGRDMFCFYFREEPRKMSKYGITQRVREMQRKDLILKWADRMTGGENREWDVHCCYQIFKDIAIWLEENAKVEKPLPKD